MERLRRKIFWTRSAAGQRASGGLVFLLAVLLEAPVLAQPKRPFWTRWPDGRLRLAFEYNGERWFRKQMETLKLDEYTFTEELRLRTDGYIYHPRLLKFDAAGLLALEQVFIDSNATTRDLDTDALDYGHDVRGSFLKENPLSFDLFSQRQNREVRQSFFGVTEVTDTHSGGDVHFKFPVLPTRLHFDHATTKGEGIDLTDQVLDTFLLESSNQYRGSDTRLRYEFNNLELKNIGERFAIHNALLTNLFRFGADDQHRTTTTAHFRDQSGLVENQLTGLQNTTVLAHTPKFSTQYVAQLNLNRIGSNETRIGTGSIGLNHTLFQNLTTSLTAFAGRSEIDGGAVDSYGGRADWQYRRGLPFGSIQAGYGLEYSIQEEEDLGDVVQVIDEPHTFRIGEPIVLDQRFPDLSSVVVKDSGGLIIYEEGRDYILVPAGSSLRVEITVGSRIADGQGLLIDYRRRTLPDREFSKFIQRASLQLNFAHFLTIYGNWTREDVNLLSGSSAETLGDSERRGAGAQVYWGPSTTIVEFEQNISPFVPYERLLVRELLAKELWRGISGTLGGSYVRTRFPEERKVEETADGTAGARFHLGNYLYVELDGGYRWGQFRTEDARGFFTNAMINWKYRAYDIRLSARHVDNEFRVANDYRENRILFEIRREF
ncbi:MAG: hypothetical protein HY717_09050 [Planctomycetes bacterium]|nr:hypothetical protein [Planctomycetota bacterium]